MTRWAKHIIYVSRAESAHHRAQDVVWQKIGAGFTLRLSYSEMCHDMRYHARAFMRYDEQEGGDFADWLENGPFHAMRYYPAPQEEEQL